MRVEEKGEFVRAEVPIPRQRIRDVILLPFEPLTVSFDVCVHENRRIFSCRVDTSRCLDGIFIRFDKVGFPHPSLRCRAVSHAEGAVAGCQAAVDDVDPGRDNCGEEFE